MVIIALGNGHIDGHYDLKILRSLFRAKKTTTHFRATVGPLAPRYPPMLCYSETLAAFEQPDFLREL